MKRKTLLCVLVVAVAVVGAAFIIKSMAPPPKLPIKTNDPWLLQSNDPNNKYSPYLGNGFIGAVIGPEGVGSRDGKPLLCLMAGLYNKEEVLDPLPNWSDFPLYDEHGKRFVLDKKAPYRQTLNMREGYIETELTLKSGRQRLVGKVTFLMPRRTEDKLADGIIHYELMPSREGFICPGVRLSRATYVNDVDFDVRITKDGIESEWDKVGVTPGEKVDLTKYVRVMCKRPGVMYHPVLSLGPAEAAVKAGYARVSEESRASWRNLWKSDIVIDGDPQAQQAIHAMMFYLLCSAGSDWSIPPCGLSLGGWGGHVFWDADTWMFPALVLQHPDLARGIVNYRLAKLPGYRQNAKNRDLAGAEVAWESAETGLETAGYPYHEERHVTADAAIAASLLPPSLPTDDFILQTATYWASRVTFNKAKDRYEILKVLPPDEDADIRDNSVYTNAAAKRNIELAIAVMKHRGKSYPAKWDDIVRKMYIPFDEKNHRFVAYDGYNGRGTKQADTELLIYPLCYPMPDDVKRNTYDYYKTKTRAIPYGPAMTSSIHSIIAAELDRPDEAYAQFLASYEGFLRGPFLVFNEKRSKTYEMMCFLTGCGGTIQSVINGFGGLRIMRNPGGFTEIQPNLYIKPCLPPKWKKLGIRNIQWKGPSCDLVVTKGNAWELRRGSKVIKSLGR